MPMKRLGIGAGVLALGVAGLFGGFDKVEADDVDVVAPSTMYPGEPWNVTVTGAGFSTDTEVAKPDNEGDRWLAVGVTVEDTDTESIIELGDAIRLRGVDGLVGHADDLGTEPAHVFLSKDGEELQALHPGMPEKLLFFWEQKADAQVPKELEVVIIGKTKRPSSLDEHVNWWDAEARAVVRLPMKDLDG